MYIFLFFLKSKVFSYEDEQLFNDNWLAMSNNLKRKKIFRKKMYTN